MIARHAPSGCHRRRGSTTSMTRRAFHCAGIRYTAAAAVSESASAVTAIGASGANVAARGPAKVA